MKRHLKLFGASLLSVGWTGLLFAGNQIYNFDLPPASDPLFSGANPAIVLGTHNFQASTAPGPNNQQIWCSGAGVGTNGFPKTGGYLSLCDGTNINNNLVVVFPDIDNGLPLAGFQIDLDMRVGNGSLGRPADGFSINFARSGDQVLINATNGIVNGFAGGTSVADANNPLGNSVILEAGTKSGVAVCFDAWQGNYLNDTTPYSGVPGSSNDREGIYVRIDDQTKVIIDLINNRNEIDCTNTISNPLVGSGFVGSSRQTSLVNNGSGLSMQTGTNAPMTGSFYTCSATYGQTTATGSFTNLYWEHLMVQLTNISTTAVQSNRLSVVWKGVTVIQTNLDVFSAASGRLVLAGRCGGNNQNVHFDNIHLVTTPSTNCTLQFVHGQFFGFAFELADNPASGLSVSSVDNVFLDNVDVTSVVKPNNLTYNAPLTDGSYTQAVRFATLTTHSVGIVFHDSAGGSNTVTGVFTVPAYAAFPTNYALPLTAIDTTKAGFLINAWQSLWNNPNVIGWTDELLEGLHGTNMVINANAGNPVYNGYQVWNNVMGFFNYGGKSANQAAGNQGMFNGAGPLGNLGGATGDADFTSIGIGINTYDNGARHDFYDNATIEMFGYIYFPTSGIYQMSFGNDDQFQISVSQSPYDRLGKVILASTAVRVPNSGSLPLFGTDVRSVFIDQAGAYPIRLVWENGTGGCSFEWYTYPSGSFGAAFYGYLVNDVANAASPNAPGYVLLGYYDIKHDGSADTGPYVTASQPPRNPDGTTQQYVSMYFYSPIVIDLVDGTTFGGTGKQINRSTIGLNVDGTAIPFNATGSAPNCRVQQSSTPHWPSGFHTITLSFNDNNGTNYTYSWPFGVVGGGAGGLAQLDVTNAYPFAATNLVTIGATNLNGNVLSLSSSLAQPLSALDLTKPGARVRTWQTPMETGQSHSGYYEGEMMGQKGFNVADLSNAQNGYFIWNGLFDFRYDSAGGGSGEWNFDLEDTQNNSINNPGGSPASLFGVGPNAQNPILSPLMPPGPSDPSYRFIYSGLNTKCEQSVWEFSGWLAFQNPGFYIFCINQDDGGRLMFPQGSPIGKLPPYTTPYVTNLVFESNTGRGIAGPSGGVFNQGTTLQLIYVPQAGAYPFRVQWYNGGTGAAFEWSVVQANPDGRVVRMPINAPAAQDGTTFDPATANAVKVYQALTSGTVTAPYIAYVDPCHDEQDALQAEPTVVDIADGPTGKTINLGTANIQLYSDGILQNIGTPTQAGGKTHVVQQMAPGFFWLNGNHTNLLAYTDAGGTRYTNVWWFNARVPNNNVVFVPASMRVDPSQVDHGQPGFRIKGYQVVAGGGGNIGSTANAEQVHQGSWGPNLITPPPSGYFTWTNAIDFCDNIGANGAHGEYRYNYSFSNSLGATINAGGGNTENNLSYIFAGWFEFTKPGFYAMTVNSDDGFKVSMPYGSNPFSENGLNLGWADAGRGDTGGSVNPFNGSSTPTFFYIPQAGAYPIRMIWFNGGGGLALEWTLFQPDDDGGLERVLIGDFASYPNQVKVYQTLTTNPPSVLNVAVNSTTTNSAAPGLFQGAQPQFLLGSSLGFGAQTSSQLSTLGAAQDFFFNLQDGSVGINTSTIQVSLNGVVQPITVVSNALAAGLNTVWRYASSGLWPSGAWGPVMVSFNDVNGNHYSYPVAYVMTPFWGTLHKGFDPSWADVNSPGFKVKAYQVDPAFTSSGLNMGPVTTTGDQAPPNRNYITEQVLTGLWGPNWINQSPTNYTGNILYNGFTDFGYQDLKGTGPTNGVINLNGAYPAQGGDFQYSAAYRYFNNPMPGILGVGPTTAGSARANANCLEILGYVAFPTNGTYTLGVSSDDGFRLWQQWDRPANIGTLVINSPAGIAHTIPATLNVFEMSQQNISCPVTNAINGNLVLATGAFGASTNGEGMVLANGSALAGNIALMYRGVNGVGSTLVQVQNAAAAGAKAVVLIQKRRPTTDGVFAEEFTVSPMQPIPLVCIEEADGTNIVGALASGPVNVTITPDDHAINPVDDRVLGMTSVGKGNSDCNFSVVVTNAPGLYPLRLTYENGTGGINVDWYSLTGDPTVNGGRVLINDVGCTNGLALKAFFSLIPPKVTENTTTGQLTISWVGTLLSSSDPTAPVSSWTPVVQTSPYTFTPSASQPVQFYRALYPQRQ